MSKVTGKCYHTRASLRGIFSYRVGSPDGIYRCTSITSRIKEGELIRFHPKPTCGGFSFCFVTIHGNPQYDWINIHNIEPVRGYIKTKNNRGIINARKIN